MPAYNKFPQIISHRGASGYVPEHSLAGYQLALDVKTDYIEPDLCISKDGVFIAMHDLLLDDTTNVASMPEYDDRYTTKVVEGKNMSGYFVNDFTVDELKTLRLKQRLSGRSVQFDNLLQIPTFTEIMSLSQSNYASTNITRGLYIELKHPAYHASLGYHMGDMLLDALVEGGFAVNASTAGESGVVPSDLHTVVPVVIQCFEPDTLMDLANKTDIPLIQLWNAPMTDEVLTAIAAYADGVGPEKNLLAGYDKSYSVVRSAEEQGLLLHPWTMRADRDIMPAFNGDFAAEEEYFYCCLKVAGLFTEFPDRSREVSDDYITRGAGAPCAITCTEY